MLGCINNLTEEVNICFIVQSDADYGLLTYDVAILICMHGAYLPHTNNRQCVTFCITYKN